MVGGNLVKDAIGICLGKKDVVGLAKKKGRKKCSFKKNN